MKIFKRFHICYLLLCKQMRVLISESPSGFWKTTDVPFISAATHFYCELSVVTRFDLSDGSNSFSSLWDSYLYL